MIIKKLNLYDFYHHEKDEIPLRDLYYLYKSSLTFKNADVIKTIAKYEENLVLTEKIRDKIFLYDGEQCIELFESKNEQNESEDYVEEEKSNERMDVFVNILKTFKDDDYIDCVIFETKKFFCHLIRTEEEHFSLTVVFSIKKDNIDYNTIFEDPSIIFGKFKEIVSDTHEGLFEISDLVTDCSDGLSNIDKNNPDNEVNENKLNDEESVFIEQSVRKTNNTVSDQDISCHLDIDNRIKSHEKVEISEEKLAIRRQIDEDLGYQNNKDTNVKTNNESEDTKNESEDTKNESDDTKNDSKKDKEQFEPFTIRYGSRKADRLTYVEKKGKIMNFGSKTELETFFVALYDQFSKSTYDFIEISGNFTIYFLKNDDSQLVFFNYEFNPYACLSLNNFEHVFVKIREPIKS